MFYLVCALSYHSLTIIKSFVYDVVGGFPFRVFHSSSLPVAVTSFSFTTHIPLPLFWSYRYINTYIHYHCICTVSRPLPLHKYNYQYTTLFITVPLWLTDGDLTFIDNIQHCISGGLNFEVIRWDVDWQARSSC